MEAARAFAMEDALQANRRILQKIAHGYLG